MCVCVCLHTCVCHEYTLGLSSLPGKPGRLAEPCCVFAGLLESHGCERLHGGHWAGLSWPVLCFGTTLSVEQPPGLQSRSPDGRSRTAGSSSQAAEVRRQLWDPGAQSSPWLGVEPACDLNGPLVPAQAAPSVHWPSSGHWRNTSGIFSRGCGHHGLVG